MKNTKWMLVALAPIVSMGCDSKRENAAEERAEQREELRQDTPAAADQQQHPLRAEERQRGVEPSTNQATAKRGMHAEAVQRIAEARCAREQKCGNIGADKDYQSVEQCRTKISEDWREELNAYECPGGVVTKELEECLEEVRNEDCGSPFDTLGRIMACRESDICKAVN